MLVVNAEQGSRGRARFSASSTAPLDHASSRSTGALAPPPPFPDLGRRPSDRAAEITQRARDALEEPFPVADSLAGSALAVPVLPKGFLVEAGATAGPDGGAEGRGYAGDTGEAEL